jgi:hypothetical protein
MPTGDQNQIEGGQKQADSTSKKGPSKRRKGLIILGVVIFVALLLSAAWYLYAKTNSKEGAKTTDPCSGKLLDEAAGLLYPTDFTKSAQLQSLAAKIVKSDNYDKYPNCLYPVMQSYVYMGDLDKAIQTFNKLEAVYGDGSSFASQRFVTNINNLREQAKVYKEQVGGSKAGTGIGTFGDPVDTEGAVGN